MNLWPLVPAATVARQVIVVPSSAMICFKTPDLDHCPLDRLSDHSAEQVACVILLERGYVRIKLFVLTARIQIHNAR